MHISSLGHVILILCSFSLMLHAQRRSNKYQFNSLWLDRSGLQPMNYSTRGEHANYYIKVTKRKEEKKKKKKTMIQIILQGILKIEQHEPHMKSGGEFRCSGMVSCSFSISDDHHVTLYLSRCQVMT
jgi:hypothetical protein